MIKTKPGKLYRCTANGCQERHERRQAFVRWCSPECGAVLAQAKLAKMRTQEAKTERRADKAKRDRLKTRAEWQKDAQTEFNAYIRARDAHLPCISCGRHHDGQWHAGHYLSRGARPELAFEESNCHKQCAPCNTHLSGNLVLYRVNLIARIGLERVEWMEGPHDPVKRTVDSLKALIKTYREKRKELETS